MPLIKQVDEQLNDLLERMPSLTPEIILREAVDSRRIFSATLAEAHRFCLVRLADHWPRASIQQLIQLFSDAMIEGSDLLRFHYAQAIGELCAVHGLSLMDEAQRFIRVLPVNRRNELQNYFGYFISAYQLNGGSTSSLLELERTLRQRYPDQWVRLMFQLPLDCLSGEQREVAQRIQSMDGLRLLQRFRLAGFSLPPALTSHSPLIRYERMAPSAARDELLQSVRSTTELMIGSLNDTAPAGLKHSTTDFLMERARLDPGKRAFNTIMHFVQLIKLDRDIASGLHARDRAIEMLDWLRPSEVDRLVIELRNSLGASIDSHVPVIPRLLAEALLRSPERKWNQVIDLLHEMIKSGTHLQSIQALQTIYYLMDRSVSVELQSRLLLCLLSGVAHHREELSVLSLTTIAQLLRAQRLVPDALQTILRKLIIALAQRRERSTSPAYFLQPSLKIIHEATKRHPFLLQSAHRRKAFFPGSFDPFSLGHEAVARAVADLGYDVYLAIDEFSWSKRTQPNRVRREIMRLSIADELHLYEFPESISINIARDLDLERLQTLLGEDVALIVGEDVIRGASAYQRSGKIRELHHLVFARDVDSDIERLTEAYGLSIERIELRGFENISSTLIRTSLDTEQDISQLIDPLARQFIYDYDSYRHRQLTKDSLVLDGPALVTRAIGNSYEIRDDRKETSLRYSFQDDTIVLQAFEGKCLPLVSEVLADGCRNGYSFARAEIVIPDLEYLGFLDQQVDLRTPCSLQFDLDDLIKEEYRSEPAFLEALTETRLRLMKSICTLYPGHFVFPLFQHRVYQKLAQLITTKNQVPLHPTNPRQLGPYLAVPFGEILKKRVLPNTATKSLHTEKYFERNLSRWQIEEAPDYLLLRHQVQMVESFGRPILLVDDLLNKGYRLNRVMPLFQESGLHVDMLFLGLITQRGRTVAEHYGLTVEAAYELPNLRHWFSESKCYPYLGGDSVRGVVSEVSPAFWPSMNLIYPYATIPFLKHLPLHVRYDFSAVCLENAIGLLETLEDLYQSKTYRYPQLRHLPELCYLPRYPYHGSGIHPEQSIKPSQLLRRDLEHLERLR